jgi:hypothetical protein
MELPDVCLKDKQVWPAPALNTHAMAGGLRGEPDQQTQLVEFLDTHATHPRGIDRK